VQATRALPSPGNTLSLGFFAQGLEPAKVEEGSLKNPKDFHDFQHLFPEAKSKHKVGFLQGTSRPGK